MELKNKILSIFIAILVVFSSMLQFHHHNEYSEICLFSTSQTDYSSCSFCEHDIEAAHDHHHHGEGCKDNHSSDERNCSIHLSNVNVVKRVSLEKPIVITVFNPVLFPVFFLENDQISSAIDDCYLFPVLKFLFLKSQGFRAPPVI